MTRTIAEFNLALSRNPVKDFTGKKGTSKALLTVLHDEYPDPTPATAIENDSRRPAGTLIEVH